MSTRLFNRYFISRIRVLPPIDERMYRALLRTAVAVLDPFPVGMHYQVLDAIIDGVPVVSQPPASST